MSIQTLNPVLWRLGELRLVNRHGEGAGVPLPMQILECNSVNNRKTVVRQSPGSRGSAEPTSLGASAQMNPSFISGSQSSLSRVFSRILSEHPSISGSLLLNNQISNTSHCVCSSTSGDKSLFVSYQRYALALTLSLTAG